jgi:tRNA A37 threonylcarbamoyladenosine dehydratase
MDSQFSRTEMMFGKDAVEKLKDSAVAVFGIGGVGGYTLEALVRSGVGHIDIIDSDKVALSNINRQIIATHKTIGKAKVDVASQRAKDINPDVEIGAYKLFYLPETANRFDFSKYDYIVDAVDTVSAKIDIIERASKMGIPVISCMGAGNKIDPTKFEVTDISKTSVCPLAKAVRTELRRRGVNHAKVVYSKEPPLKPTVQQNGKPVPSSNAFVPPVAGLIIAGEVIKDLIKG